MIYPFSFNQFGQRYDDASSSLCLIFRQALLNAFDPMSLSALMWEWQRRDPNYIAFTSTQPEPVASNIENVIRIRAAASGDVKKWGCAFAEKAELPATMARILWTKERDPSVLEVTAKPASLGSRNSFDISQLAERIICFIDDFEIERFSFGSVSQSLRLDVVAGTLLDGPVELIYHLPGFEASEPGLQTVKLLHGLQRYACLPPLPLDKARIGRKGSACLQTYDALVSGATQREIGALIFGNAAVDYGWDSRTDKVRSAVKRLIREARFLAAGGYRSMLLSQ